MRIAISGLLTATFLFSAAVAAEDQPEPAVSSTPPTAPADAPVSPAPAEAATPAAPQTAAQPAVPASNAIPAQPAATPEAGAAPASAVHSAETSAAASAATVKDEAAAMDEQMKRLGYKVTTMNGQRRYCKADSVSGSRLNQKQLCWTADQIKSHQSNVDYMREKQGQRKTWGD